MSVVLSREPSSWARLPRWVRAVAVVLAVVVVVELAQQLVGGTSGGGASPSGPSSTYNSGSDGTQAWADLLRAYGHPVVQRLSPLSAGAIHGGALVIMEPQSWSPADGRAARAFASGGGQVVVAGATPAGLLSQLLGGVASPRSSGRGAGAIARPSNSRVALPGVTGVATANDRSWSGRGGTLALLRGSGGLLATRAQVGSGAVYLFASASPFQDRWLDRADNAKLALDLAGPAGSAVVFDEYDHGYASSTGLAGLPARWKWGLGLGLVAVLVWMLARSRRLGPVEQPERDLVPARIAYVHGLARVVGSSLGSGDDPQLLAQAVAPVHERARRLLDRAAGGAVADSQTTIVRAAAAGVPESVATAVSTEPRTTDEVVALGRALAWLEQDWGHGS